CSDGLDTPVALLTRARAKGLSVVSITDHDSLAAYPDARQTALELGLELVTGIEVTTYYNGGSVHILGYFLDESSDAAKKLVEGNNSGRLDRMHRMLKKISALGYKVDFAELAAFAGEATLGRVALARFMVQAGYFKNPEEAFETALGDNKAGFEPVTSFTPQQAIEFISEAGGVSSLAHPNEGFDYKSLEQFAEAGLGAVEAFTPHHGPATRRKWTHWAARLGLAVSGGSDCHGPHFRNQDVGDAGLDRAMFDELRARATAPAREKFAATGGGNETA
ncbi:MAG: PHP domain-containing protein, partial [Nitrospinota bacterium]|nr:PHP domain-containing protein [Nitrospinota bacterium]